MASCDQGRVDHRPDRNQVILTTRKDVFGIWGPADARETTIIRVIEVEKPKRRTMSVAYQGGVSGEDYILFLQVVNDSERSIFTDHSQVTTVRRE